MIRLPKNHHIRIRGPRPKNLTMKRDDHGVPHIHADNPVDLNWGLGYCMAVDRGMQLQFMRILGQGRLCELLDDTDDNLKVDAFFRRMNWQHSDTNTLSKLKPETLEWCQALCNGINAGMHSKRVSLMRAISGAPEPWTIRDVLLIYRMGSYLTLSQTQAESERLFIELVQAGMSKEKLEAIFPIQDQQVDFDLIKQIKLNERLLPLELLWQSAAPRVMASNNWVVSGEHTASGAALMANDPHLEVNRLPNVWYEVALKTPEFSGAGYGMPGLPGLLIGRTEKISWGATYTFADTVDSWIEDCKGGKYRRGKSWRKFSVRKEQILRKKHAPHTLSFYENAHGVLDGAPSEDGLYLSTQWSPADHGAESLNAALEIMRAENAEDARRALGKIESAWNWVIADDQGNIAYQMSGLCPKRKNGWNGFTPGKGWEKDDDWQGFHSLEDLPRAYNPKCGYFVTANQDLNEFGNISCINMPMTDHRARRIEERIKQSSQHNLKSTRDIQMDTFSLQAEEFMAVLKPVISDQIEDCFAARLLCDWDLNYDQNSIGAVLFERFYSELRKLVFADETISPELIEHLTEQSCLFIDFYQNYDRCLLDETSIWYGDKSQKEFFKEAFEQARASFVAITWGQKNSFSFNNILTQGKLPSFVGFDSDELPLIGGRATPHQGQIYESAGRKTSFAPSVRIVADMSKPYLHSRTAGGISDNPLSHWYMSEIQGWLDGSYKVVDP